MVSSFNAGILSSILLPAALILFQWLLWIPDVIDSFADAESVDTGLQILPNHKDICQNNPSNGKLADDYYLLKSFVHSLQNNNTSQPLSMTISYRRTDSGYHTFTANASAHTISHHDSGSDSMERYQVQNGSVQIGFTHHDQDDFIKLATHKFDRIILSEHGIEFGKVKQSMFFGDYYDPIAVLCRNTKRLALWNMAQSLMQSTLMVFVSVIVARVVIGLLTN